MAKAVFRRLGLFTEPDTYIKREGVDYWRELIFNYMLSAALVLGLVALIPSVWLAFATGLTSLGIIDVVAYVFIASLLYLRKIRFELRAGLFLLTGYFVGLTVFTLTGEDGAGLFWIFAIAPMASLLLGLRKGAIFFLCNVMFVLGIGYLIIYGIPLWPRILEISLASWLVYGVNFVTTNALVTFPLGALLDGLFHSVQSEQRTVHDYQILFDNNPLPMWVYDAETLRFLAVNGAAIEHYGYSRQEFLSMTIKDIRPAEEIPKLEKNLYVARKERQVSGPWKHIKRDGSIIEVEISSNSLTFAGRSARLVLANDITNRLRAESQLRLSDEILQRVTSLVLVIDVDTNVIYASPSVEPILGFKPDELLGEGWWQKSRIDTEQSDLERKRLQFALHGNKPFSPKPYERTVQTKSGETRWIEWQDALGPNHTLIGVGRDVTENVKSRQALEESEELYRVLAENSQTLICTHDLEGRILSINEVGTRLSGFSREEIMKLSLRDLIVPEKRRLFDRYLSVIKRAGRAHGLMEIMTARGERRIWEYNNVLAVEPGGTQVVRGMAQDVTVRKQSEERIRKQLSFLETLSQIDRSILSNFDMHMNLKSIVDNVVNHLGVDAANIMLFNPHLQTLESVYGNGFRTGAFEHRQIYLGEGYAGRAALERNVVHVTNLEAQKDNPRLARALLGEGFTSYYGVPLIARGEIRGVLEVFHRKALVGDQEWMSLLTTLAGQAAIAIDTAKTFENLQRSNAELVLSYDAAIEGWSRALDLRDKETEGHTQRVTELAVRLAKEVGLSDKKLVHFRRGALLHDIGKMGVPDSILHKPDKLTEAEWEIMRKHPTHARDMLQSITYLQDALDIPYAHHEKWDGSGYPLGLKGEAIPLSARIFAVVDVYDAVTSDRPYRKAWTKKEAIAYIQDQSGKHFDPAIVAAFLKLDLS